MDHVPCIGHAYGFKWEEDTRDVNPVECDLDAEIMYYPEDDRSGDPIETTFRRLIEMDKKFMHKSDEIPYVILSTEY